MNSKLQKVSMKPFFLSSGAPRDPWLEVAQGRRMSSSWETCTVSHGGCQQENKVAQQTGFRIEPKMQGVGTVFGKVPRGMAEDSWHQRCGVSSSEMEIL